MTSDGDELLRSFLTGVPESEPQTDRILDAALRSFETYGPRRTTMDDVARESGLGRATIYRRFPTKGDLVTGVLLREARRFFAELDEAVAALPTLEERLVEGFAVALRISREQRLVTRLMVVEPELILPHSTVKAARCWPPPAATCRAGLRTAQRRGAAPPDVDPEVVAEILVRLTHSLVLTPEGHIPLDDDGARDFARRYLLPIVRNTPA